ncbi:hypothetical protein HPB49_014451 [Dermacentor silvarum]|uniref:Uncharacterized protein n=1 Tax=Dermacentor silvarum TaxID=543639 RepID=A0ACB8E0Y7_DERSI|nr:hypothetical protein HPB49_014451 [Dermacentor silvarum]
MLKHMGMASVSGYAIGRNRSWSSCRLFLALVSSDSVCEAVGPRKDGRHAGAEMAHLRPPRLWDVLQGVGRVDAEAGEDDVRVRGYNICRIRS